MILLLSIFTLIAVAFIGTDLVMAFREWQARIHIGRWKDRISWQQALEHRARKWIYQSPTVRLTDNNRGILLDILKGKYRIKTIQSWQDAGLLMGLDKTFSANYATRNFNPQSGEWKQKPENPDAALLAYVLKKNEALPLQAETEICNLLKEHAIEGQIISYRKALPYIRFVDTIGMVTPFMTLCGQPDIVEAQIKEYDKALLPGTSIPYHAYDLERNVPLGVCDWGRGLGWYILGITESNIDGRYNNRITTLAREIMRFRLDEGGYGAMFFNRKSRFESSGSALIGLLMINAYRIIPEEQFLKEAFSIEKKLMASTRRNGAIDYCQGDTKGIGYYSSNFTIMPFIQGITLKLSKELNQYADR